MSVQKRNVKTCLFLFNRKKRQEFITWLTFVLPALFFLIVFIVYPLIRTFTDSFFQYEFLRKSDMKFVGIQNYITMVQDPIFWRAIKNNFLIGTFSIVFQIGLGTLLAAILTRGVKRAQYYFRMIVFMPMVFSTIAIGLLWQLIFDPNIGQLEHILQWIRLQGPALGWLGDSKLAMYSIIFVACWQYTGFMMVILISAMICIPEEQYESAKVEGAGEIYSFFYITIPNLKNTFIVCVFITMIGAMKVYDLIYALTRFGPNNATQVISGYLYINAFRLDKMGYANAMGVTLLVIAVVLGIFHKSMGRKV